MSDCLVGPLVYFHTSCVRTAKALARLRECAGSPEPSLVANPKRTIFSWAGAFVFCFSIAWWWGMEFSRLLASLCVCATSVGCREKTDHGTDFLILRNQWDHCNHDFCSRTASIIFKPPHDKTNEMACAPSEDHPPSLISLRYPLGESLDP